jgi:murein DD-endopeptidase MepM/ murein hydrolase activator NlpD
LLPIRGDKKFVPNASGGIRTRSSGLFMGPGRGPELPKAEEPKVEEPKKKRKIKRPFIYVLVCILALTVGFTGFKLLYDPHMTAYQVMLDGFEIGVVADASQLPELFGALQDEKEQDIGVPLVRDQELTIEPVKVMAENVATEDQIETNLSRYLTDTVEAEGVYVNGQLAVVTQTEEDAQWVLEQALEPYEQIKTEKDVKDIKFLENVETKPVEVSYERVQAKEDAYTTLTVGSNEHQEYTVKKGDTLWSIAQNNDIRISDIRKANPEVSATDVINVGQKLDLTVTQNLVNVQYVETLTREEELKYETEVQQDDTMYNTQKKVIQEGKIGKRQVVTEVTKVNGVEVSNKVVQETVLEPAVNEIIAKGTKEPPKDTPASSGGGGTSASGFGWPTSGPLTSGYGTRWGRLHAGIDIGVATGTPVYASKSGTVIASGWYSGYGKLVKVDHGNGQVTYYAHNSKLLVNTGTKVSKGQLLCLSGNTGNSTGPHCHFEIRINGSPVNPMKYLP